MMGQKHMCCDAVPGIFSRAERRQSDRHKGPIKELYNFAPNAQVGNAKVGWKAGTTSYTV